MDMKQMQNFPAALRVTAVLLAAVLLLCTGCASEAILMSSQAYLMEINELVVEDFGALTVTENLDADTTVTQISDRLYLTMAADPVTGYVRRAELALYIDPDIEELDYSSFSYFFLIMLKAYDENITVTNINSIHDALGIGDYSAGVSSSIGYGSSNYYYTVTEEMALFSAEFIVSANETT